MRNRVRVCAEDGCPTLTEKTRCPVHAAEFDRQYVRAGASIYGTKRWRDLRDRVLREQPVCAEEDCVQPSTDVDHIVAVQDGGSAYDRSNVQGLCHEHHSAKTARELRERGAYGREQFVKIRKPPEPEVPGFTKRVRAWVEAARPLVLAGASDAEIAEALGVSPNVVPRLRGRIEEGAR